MSSSSIVRNGFICHPRLSRVYLSDKSEYFNSLSGFFSNLLEHYAIVKTPSLQTKILNLILLYPEVSDEVKVKYFEGLIYCGDIQNRINQLLEQASFLNPISQKEIIKTLIYRLIDKGNFEDVLEQCHQNQIDTV